jgi:hypothetical protein
MLSKIDKAWASALVSFLSLTALQFFGFEISPTLQAAAVSLITMVATWAVPNMPSENP